MDSQNTNSQATENQAPVAEKTPQQKRDEEKAAKYRAHQEKMSVKIAAVWNRIASDLEKAGHTFESGATGSINKVDGFYVRIEVSEDHDNSGCYRWNPIGKGKLRVNVGPYGETTGYPERKDGSFSFDKIVENLVRQAVGQKTKIEREAKEKAARDTSKPIAAKLNAEFGFSEYGNVCARVSDYGTLRVKVDEAVTEEQARAILAAVKSILGK